jgi:mRNA interferase RelE/StbE
MTFNVVIKKSALKFISKLPKEERIRIKNALLLLKEDPIPIRLVDVAKLRGLKNIYRIRVGKIRMIYEINWNNKTIAIHRVSFREHAYRKIQFGSGF